MIGIITTGPYGLKIETENVKLVKFKDIGRWIDAQISTCPLVGVSLEKAGYEANVLYQVVAACAKLDKFDWQNDTQVEVRYVQTYEPRQIEIEQLSDGTIILICGLGWEIVRK